MSAVRSILGGVLLALVAFPAAAQSLPAVTPPTPEAQALDRAVVNYVGPFTTELTAVDWKTCWKDLNGDACEDALVYVAGPDWCGSGGCTLLIFEAVVGPDVEELGSYRPAAEISLVHGPVLVSETRTGEWSDLVIYDAAGSPRVLQFDGETYPTSPSEGMPVTTAPSGQVVFAGTQ